MNETLPVKREIAGVTIFVTRLLTIPEKAPPIITPTARSITLPFEIKSLNSLKKPVVF